MHFILEFKGVQLSATERGWGWMIALDRLPLRGLGWSLLSK